MSKLDTWTPNFKKNLGKSDIYKIWFSSGMERYIKLGLMTFGLKGLKGLNGLVLFRCLKGLQRLQQLAHIDC